MNTQIGLNTKRPTHVFFLGPTKPFQSYGWKKARIADTVLVKSREMTSRSQKHCRDGRGEEEGQRRQKTKCIDPVVNTYPTNKPAINSKNHHRLHRK